jgi:hypothetical protein
MPNSRVKVNQGTPGVKFVEEPWLKKYIQSIRPAYQRYYGLREGFLQTDEQLGIREYNGKNSGIG